MESISGNKTPRIAALKKNFFLNKKLNLKKIYVCNPTKDIYKFGLYLNYITMNLRNFKTQIIAEIAQSHKGSINLAKKMIELSSQAGADYVKFQAHYSNYESTLDEKFRKGFNFKEKNRYEYWKNFEFTKKQSI